MAGASQTLFACGFKQTKAPVTDRKHKPKSTEPVSKLYKQEKPQNTERKFDRRELKDPSSHITNSSAYERAYHYVSGSSGHQQSNGRSNAVVSCWSKQRAAKLSFQAPTAETSILKNCTVYLNGYCGDKEGNLELERLIHINGGKVVKAFTKSRITHLLTASGLSGTKIEKEVQARKNTIQLVHPDWVLESIKLGKRCSESNFPCMEMETQPQLKKILDALPVSDATLGRERALQDWDWIQGEEQRRKEVRERERAPPSAQASSRSAKR